MNKNLAPGDLASIIDSVDKVSIGRIVQCSFLHNEQHYIHGPIWHVRTREPIQSEYGGMGNEVDVPAKWLKKIEPGDLDKSTDRTRELTKEDTV